MVFDCSGGLNNGYFFMFLRIMILPDFVLTVWKRHLHCPERVGTYGQYVVAEKAVGFICSGGIGNHCFFMFCFLLQIQSA